MGLVHLPSSTVPTTSCVHRGVDYMCILATRQAGKGLAVGGRVKEQGDGIRGLRPEQKEVVFLQEITPCPTRAGETLSG